MARRFLPLLLVLLLTAAPAVQAQETPPANETPAEGEAPAAGPVAITLLAVNQGGNFVWTDESGAVNPTLTVPAGADVAITIRQEASSNGIPHNLKVGNGPTSDLIQNTGDEAVYTFTAPESGQLDYVCTIHPSSMRGKINVGGAAPAPAAEAPTSYELEAHAEGTSFFFTLKGETQRNPTLYVKPGAEITLTLTGVSGTHNIQVDGFAASDYVNPGDTITYTFTAPQSGVIQYWCVPHKSSNMVGRVQAGAPTTGGGGAGGDSPEVTGPSVDLATLGYADCAGFMIPQSVADGVVGGPTVDDYVKLCREGEQQGGTVRERHIADYVIPATWVLIGLGVIGVVYVNRHYKP